MNAISGIEVVCEVANENVEPIPPVVPGDFVVHLGEGWGYELHELANGLAVWKDGPEIAISVLLGCLEFVWIEAIGVPECQNLVEGIGLLKGTVMTAGIEALKIRMPS